VTLSLLENAFAPIFIAEFPIEIEAKFLLPSNADSPIDTTELGIVKIVMFGFCEKELKVGVNTYLYDAKA
jgi:hypothetical protein